MGKDFDFNYLTFKEFRSKDWTDSNVFKNITYYKEIIEWLPGIREDLPCLFLLANEKKEIVSSMRAYPDRLTANRKKYNWMWLGDVYTDSKYRGKGLAQKIIKGAEGVLHESNFAWAAMGQNDITIHILKKLGFKFPGFAKRYIAIKTVKPILRAYFDNVTLGRFISFFCDWIFKLWLYAKTKNDEKKIKTIEVKIGGKNEKDFAANMAKRIQKKMFYFEESPEKILWKVRAANAKQKEENLSSLFIGEDYNRKIPLFYFVVREKKQIEPLAERFQNFKRMTLMDYGLFKNTPGILHSLANAVIRMFLQSGAGVLDIVSSDKEFHEVLSKCGMFSVGRGISFFFSCPRNWDLGSGCNEIENWNFTHFTGDGFNF